MEAGGPCGPGLPLTAEPAGAIVLSFPLFFSFFSFSIFRFFLARPPLFFSRCHFCTPLLPRSRVPVFFRGNLYTSGAPVLYLVTRFYGCIQETPLDCLALEAPECVFLDPRVPGDWDNQRHSSWHSTTPRARRRNMNHSHTKIYTYGQLI